MCRGPYLTIDPPRGGGGRQLCLQHHHLFREREYLPKSTDDEILPGVGLACCFSRERDLSIFFCPKESTKEMRKKIIKLRKGVYSPVGWKN